MALLTFYATGTVSVLNGSTTVTGSGTGWGGDVILPGDLFMDPAQPEIPPQRIAAVTDATHLELAVGWPGTDMSADPYEIRFVGDIVRSTAQSRRYLEMLGQLSALGIQPNAFGAFADRDAYDDEAAGFIFLSLDGDGETDVWTLYIKETATSGDWDDGQTIAGAEGPQGEPGPKGDPGEQGGTGPANTLTIGTVEGGPAADAEITGTAPNQTLNLVLPQGDAGEDGWSPVFAIATDGARRVLQLAGYVGGTGTEPTDHVGEYVGASGYTSTIGDAVDIRGPAGAAGSGSGDMQSSVYDPQGIEGDAFDRANHTGTQSADSITDGTTNKAFTGTEKTKLGYITVTQAVDLDAIESAVVPAGGTTGQVLKKASNADNDTEWADEGGGIGGSTGSIDNRLLRADGSGGATVQPSAITVDDSGNMSGVGTINGSTPREVLSADRTYYVRSDGNDSNTGLTNNSGGAFLTIGACLTRLSRIDFGGFTVTVRIGNGSFAGYTMPRMTGLASASSLIVRSDSGTPGDVTITSSIAGAPTSLHTVRDLTVATSGVGITANQGSVINFANVVFGAGNTHHLFADGGKIEAVGNYSIAGGAAYHIWARNGGVVNTDFRTVTITGTPAFAGAFAIVQQGGYYLCGAMTFSGSATGKRYDATANGVIQTVSGGATYLPGDSAGTTATGGQYV